MNSHLDPNTLQMYFDDALEAAARAAVAAHLAHCDVCRAELDALSAVANAFASWRSEPIPRDVSAPVMARVRQRPAPHTRAHWGIAALGAQAVLAILLAAWVLPQALRVWTGVNLPQLLLPAWSWDAQMFSLPAMPDVSLPLPAMTIWMWGAILAGAVVLWFIGNRLIWRTLSHQQEASQ